MKIYLLIVFSFLQLIVFAQVEDNFNDGNFTNSPEWQGDSSDFNVNTATQLQLNAALAGNSFLLVPANLTSLDSCEWRFYIRLAFSPSTSNYTRFYLSSDQQNLELPLNGYFLQFGEALAVDAIELFRQDGSTVTSICRGQNGFIANAFAVGVKVTRNSTGLWTLYIDYNGGINYSIEANGTDTIYNNAAYVGLHCNYTSGNINKFYFDDVYAGRIIQDTILPFVTNVSVKTENILSVTLSEKITASSLNDLNNCFIDNNISNPVAITTDSLNPLKFYLQFVNSFQPGINYTITFSGLVDFNQNMMLNQSLGFIYSPLIEAQLKDVVFSEIYFENSSVSPLPNSEFIEIYNRRDSSIILSGWKISDGSSDGLIPELRLAPHSYAVLYDEDDSTDFHSIPNSLAVSSFPSLNNDVGDHLVLSNADGVIIDDLKFNDSYYHDNNKNDGGWTIEKIDMDFICDNVENWKASVSNLHGSPGLVNSINDIFSDSSSPFVENVFVTDSNLVTVIFNEGISEGIININNYTITGSDEIVIHPQFILQWSDDSIGLILSNNISNGIYTLTITEALKDCPGNSMDNGTAVRFGISENSNINDIIINELLYNSSTGGNDFVELYNRSQKIIDLNDWVIAEAGYNDSLDLMEYASITVEHKLIFPGDFLVITKEEKKVKNFYSCLNQKAFLNVSTMPDFNSEEGRVILFDHNGSAIDALQYSDKMHFALLAETKGITLERLSFSESGINSNNWHSAAATAGFGTPGYVNSQQQDLMLVDDEVSIGVEIFSPDNDGYNDVLPIHYKFPKTGTVLSLIVYDLNGLPVRTLLPGETVSSEGVINWDGVTDNLSIAAAGIYIILAKSFDLDGNEKAFKKACFLTRLY